MINSGRSDRQKFDTRGLGVTATSTGSPDPSLVPPTYPSEGGVGVRFTSVRKDTKCVTVYVFQKTLVS